MAAAWPRLPPSARRLYPRGKLRPTLHDAFVVEAEFDVPAGRVRIRLRQKTTWCPVSRIDLLFRGVELSDGDVAVWRALLRRGRIEWLYEEWDFLADGMIELRVLWYAGPRRRPRRPYFETVLRFKALSSSTRRERPSLGRVWPTPRPEVVVRTR